MTEAIHKTHCRRVQYSVIVPTCNRVRFLNILLASLSPQVGSNGEIIVSDDCWNSDQASEAMGQFPNTRVIRGPGRGPAANRNGGADAAEGDWLIFVDDDVIPDPAFVQAYIEGFAATNADVLEGRTYSDPNLDHSRCEAPVNETGGNLWSCNFAIRRNVFRAMGGFSEFYKAAGGEDTDLHKRLLDRGFVPKFWPSASVFHPPRLRRSWWLRAAVWRRGYVGEYRWGRSRGYLLFIFPIKLLRYYGSLGVSKRARAAYLAEIVAISLLAPFWMVIDSAQWSAARRQVREPNHS